MLVRGLAAAGSARGSGVALALPGKRSMRVPPKLVSASPFTRDRRTRLGEAEILEGASGSVGASPIGEAPGRERFVEGEVGAGQPGLATLQLGALVFLVACCVAATGGGRIVLLALQFLGDGVVLDDQPAGVAHRLQVAKDGIPARQHLRLVGEELQVTVYPGGDDPS